MSRYRAARILALALAALIVVAPVRVAQSQVAATQFAQGEIVGATAYPWSAIGKLNNGVGGSCTAVLISRRHALTAAHCLFFARTDRLLPPESFHLILGYQNQKFAAHFRILSYHIPSTYKPLRPYKTLAHDWALLTISIQQKPSVAPQFISLGDRARASSRLMTGGYSQRTPYAMTADQHCWLIGRSLDRNLLFDSCKVPLGYSGAPVLAANIDGSSFSVVGIHVANQVCQTGIPAIAIPIDKIWPQIKLCIQFNLCPFETVANGKNNTVERFVAGLPYLKKRIHFELASTARVTGSHNQPRKLRILPPTGIDHLKAADATRRLDMKLRN